MSLTLIEIVYYVQFQSLPGSFSLMLFRYVRVRSGHNIVVPFTNDKPYNKEKKEQVMHGLDNNVKEGEQ